MIASPNRTLSVPDRNDHHVAFARLALQGVRVGVSLVLHAVLLQHLRRAVGVRPPCSAARHRAAYLIAPAHLGQAGVLPQQIQRVIGPDHAAPAVLHPGIAVGEFSRRVNALPMDGPPGDIVHFVSFIVCIACFNRLRKPCSRLAAGDAGNGGQSRAQAQSRPLQQGPDIFCVRRANTFGLCALLRQRLRLQRRLLLQKGIPPAFRVLPFFQCTISPAGLQCFAGLRARLPPLGPQQLRQRLPRIHRVAVRRVHALKRKAGRALLRPGRRLPARRGLRHAPALPRQKHGPRAGRRVLRQRRPRGSLYPARLPRPRFPQARPRLLFPCVKGVLRPRAGRQVLRQRRPGGLPCPARLPRPRFPQTRPRLLFPCVKGILRPRAGRRERLPLLLRNERLFCQPFAERLVPALPRFFLSLLRRLKRRRVSPPPQLFLQCLFLLFLLAHAPSVCLFHAGRLLLLFCFERGLPLPLSSINLSASVFPENAKAPPFRRTAARNFPFFCKRCLPVRRGSGRRNGFSGFFGRPVTLPV